MQSPKVILILVVVLGLVLSFAIYFVFGFGPVGLISNIFFSRVAIASEFLYLEISTYANYPDLCSKIYPRARHGGLGFNPAGARDYYVQSLCLQNVAITTKNEELCSRLQVAPGGQDIVSPAVCRNAIRTGETVPPLSFNAQSLLGKLGYTDSMLPESSREYFDESLAWSRFFESIVNTAEFRQRLQQLPDFSSARTDADAYRLGRSLPSCVKPFIPRPGVADPDSREACCSDADTNGVCDEDAAPQTSLRADDISVSLSRQYPLEKIVLGQPFDFHFTVHNSGTEPTRATDVVVSKVFQNTIPLRRNADDFRMAIPSIPAGGSVDVHFDDLILRDEFNSSSGDFMVNIILCFRGECSISLSGKGPSTAFYIPFYSQEALDQQAAKDKATYGAYYDTTSKSIYDEMVSYLKAPKVIMSSGYGRLGLADGISVTLYGCSVFYSVKEFDEIVASKTPAVLKIVDFDDIDFQLRKTADGKWENNVIPRALLYGAGSELLNWKCFDSYSGNASRAGQVLLKYGAKP